MARIIANGNVGFFFLPTLASVSEAEKVQTITRSATGGTVDITIGEETDTGISIVAATTAANVLSALLAFDTVDVGDIGVTGSTGGPFTVTGNIPDIAIEDASATGGTVTVVVTSEAVSTDQYAPSAAVLDADANITEAIKSASGWSYSGQDIDAPDLSSPFPKTIAGTPTKATPSLVIYRNTDAGSKDAEVAALLPEGAEGYIIRSLNTQTPTAGTVVEVWPVRVMSNTPLGDTDASSPAPQTATVMFAVPDTPDLSAACVA